MLEPNILVGEQLVPDAEKTATFTLPAKTDSAITVDGADISAAFHSGAGFYVQDDETDSETCAWRTTGPPAAWS